jgi:predicted deacylase
MLQGSRAKTRKRKKQATVPHLEDAPRAAAVDPQRLVQRSVERGAVVAELSP